MIRITYTTSDYFLLTFFTEDLVFTVFLVFVFFKGCLDFEIEVLESEECALGVGLGDPSMDLEELPGHNSESYGYHGDDGNRYHDSDDRITDVDWPTWSENDIIKIKN